MENLRSRSFTQLQLNQLGGSGGGSPRSPCASNSRGGGFATSRAAGGSNSQSDTPLHSINLPLLHRAESYLARQGSQGPEGLLSEPLPKSRDYMDTDASPKV